ncbi:MAG: PAS domain S-box protein [SAR324 cluster bacterium]|nr:PAS domain S-box protein [SAR324 cluster bacterium]
MLQDDHYLKNELYSLMQKDASIFEFLQEGSLDGIWYWDLENPENEWLSPQLWKTLGQDPSEKKHLVSEWHGHIFPEDRLKAVENYREHHADPNVPYDQVVRFRHKNGSTLWIRSRGMLIRDSSGKATRMLGVYTDITQLKQAEEALRESEGLHRIILENIQDPVMITDDQGKFTFVGPNVPHIFGFSADEIKARGSISEVFGRELFDLKELQRLGQISNIEARIFKKNGELRNFLVAVKQVSIKGGSILYVCRDITEHKQTEERAKKSASMYQDLVETSQDLIWQCDLEGRYTYLNPAWEETFGFKTEEMLGKKFSDFQTPEYAERDHRELTQILKGKVLKGFETVHVDKNKQPIHLVFNAKNVLNEDGQIVGIRGTAYNISDRYQAEQELKKSEGNYHNLFEKMLDGFALHEIICDSAGVPVDYRFLSVNPAFENLTGLRVKDLIGQRVRQVMPNIEKHWIETYGRVALTGEPVFFENYSLELDKHFAVTAYRPAEKQFACIFQDMSPRKKAEKKLKESLQLNQMIIESSPVGLLIFKESGPCVMANPAAAAISGVSQEKLLSLGFRETDFYQQTGILADIEKVLETGEVLQRETHVINKSGKEFWYEGSISSLNIEGEKHLLLLFQDIWERKQLEANLLRQHAEFEAIFNSITDAIVFVDTDRRIIRINPAFQAILGYSFEEVKGKTTQIIYANPEDYFQQGKVRYNQKAKLAKPIYEIEYLSKDGTVFPGETLGIPVKDSQDVIVGFLGVIRDVTERHESEKERDSLKKQWAQSQKLESLGTLAGGIAHDFNNILSVVLGYTEIALEDAPEGSSLSQDLENVLQAAHRARDLVRQILAFGRQTQAERILLDPAPIFKEALKMLRASIPTTIDIQENIVLDTGTIHADPTHLHQILMNLCTNAFHAMEDNGGILKVELKPCDSVPLELENSNQSFLELSVSDTGPGIKPGIIDKIFDPFFTTKEAGKGTGMGLSISYGIVKEYGGSLTVESEPGKGTKFCVYFPQSDQDAVSGGPMEKAILMGNEHILFVDDEEVLAEMGKDMLERLGYQVTIKTRSIEALEIFQNQPDQFDLVITDQTMPGITGLDLARRMVQIRADIPIILCTGYSNLVDENFAKSRGVKEFAYKPIARKIISRLIRNVLDKP